MSLVVQMEHGKVEHTQVVQNHFICPSSLCSPRVWQVGLAPRFEATCCSSECLEIMNTAQENHIPVVSVVLLGFVIFFFALFYFLVVLLLLLLAWFP